MKDGEKNGTKNNIMVHCLGPHGGQMGFSSNKNFLRNIENNSQLH